MSYRLLTMIIGLVVISSALGADAPVIQKILVALLGGIVILVGFFTNRKPPNRPR